MGTISSLESLSGMPQVIKWKFNEAVASSCPDSAAAVDELISQQKREVEAVGFPFSFQVGGK